MDIGGTFQLQAAAQIKVGVGPKSDVDIVVAVVATTAAAIAVAAAVVFISTAVSTAVAPIAAVTIHHRRKLTLDPLLLATAVIHLHAGFSVAGNIGD